MSRRRIYQEPHRKYTFICDKTTKPLFYIYSLQHYRYDTHRVRMLLEMQLRMDGFQIVVRGCSGIVIASNNSCLLVGHVVCWCGFATGTDCCRF